MTVTRISRPETPGTNAMERLTAKIALLAVFFILLPQTAAAEPRWIWGVEGANREAPVGTCFFRKTFELAAPPEAGRIEIACDDRYVLRLNGKLVGASNRRETLDRFDVTPLLVEGENSLHVRCVNDGDAAGLVARVVVKARGHEAQELSTDETWQAAIQAGRSWNPAVFKQTDKARSFVLGPLGDTKPWAGKLEEAGTLQRCKPAGPFEDRLELVEGDRVVLIGNTLIERAQSFGYWETALTLRYPERNVTFRNLGWSGDTVFGHARARFGNVGEGYLHLVEHVYAAKPTVIVVAYGTNESFGGPQALRHFLRGLETLCDDLARTGARLALLSPNPHEDAGPRRPDFRGNNEYLQLYTEEMEKFAGLRGYEFVDLFSLARRVKQASGESPLGRLTNNGMHFSPYGYWLTGPLLSVELLGKPNGLKIEIDQNEQRPSGEGIKIADKNVSPRGAKFTATLSRLPHPPMPDSSPDRTTGLGEAVPLAVHRLDPGKYELRIDGGAITTADHESWDRGVAIRRGPDFAQVEKLRQAILKKNELYFHRWRPQNETYLYLFRKHEQGNNAREIPQFDPLVEKMEEKIARLRIPVAHRYELVRVEE